MYQFKSLSNIRPPRPHPLRIAAINLFDAMARHGYGDLIITIAARKLDHVSKVCGTGRRNRKKRGS